MDFYETSACTNLNIKEVRALKPSCPLSLAESIVGKREKVTDRNQAKMRPRSLGSYRVAKGRGGNTGLTRAPCFPSLSRV